MEKIKVLLVDDHVLFVESLRTILKTRAKGMEVVGVAFNGQEAINFVAAHHPDVVLMDIRMATMNGVESTRIIKERFPATRVLMLTTFDDDEYVEEALRIGALGYLLKDVPATELIAAIKAVYEGGVTISPKVATRLVEKLAHPGDKNQFSPKTQVQFPWLEDLSNREKEVLQLLTQGLDNKDIAKQLYIGEQTVKNYTSVIYCKMGVHDRVQAILKAKEAGFDKQRIS